MHRSLAVAVITIAGVAAGACRQVQSERPSPGQATTQPGSAADANNAPRAGAGPAGCRDLPSADDLRKWVREAPGQAEAGGLFSGRMEWASIVNRNGEICATVVATDDPASAWPGSQ